MVAALLITAIVGIIVWLVFFKFRWLRFSYAWAFALLFFLVHLLLVFVIGLRFVAPYTTDAKMIQHTIQLVPRLPEPTLVTAVLVEPNVLIKKGQPLFQFDRRPYEDKVRQLEATLAAARGQLLPSGELATFNPPPEALQGRFAVKIYLDAENQQKFPIGAQGAAAIYTGGGAFAAVRRIAIRTYTWLNWLYPIPF